MKIFLKKAQAFTLPEIMIAVSIFATVITIVSSLYIQTYKETARAAAQNQFYDDARYVLKLIADEIHDGAIDYDEYYNRYVVGAHADAGSLTVDPRYIDSYGQAFGRYYSSFFNPGNDEALGFDCNSVTATDLLAGVGARTAKRNKPECTALKNSLDIDTGQNPFSGKYTDKESTAENAFCGRISYNLKTANLDPISRITNYCNEIKSYMHLEDDPAKNMRAQLFLIDAEGKQKTILAREKINRTGGSVSDPPLYALSILRLKGVDVSGDGVSDKFVCADDFQCRGEGDVTDDRDTSGALVSFEGAVADALCAVSGSDVPAELPRSDDLALDHIVSGGDQCDNEANGFSKDFVPISPLTVNVKKLEFYISPTEDPFYAFAEFDVRSQPRVTIVLTIEPGPDFGAAGDFKELTLVETVSPRILERVPAPVLSQ